MKIIFKKDRETDEVIANFATWRGDFICYAHAGQHSYSDYGYYSKCKPATPEEYKDLKSELKSIGYNVEVIKRINGNKFRKAYQDFMEVK